MRPVELGCVGSSYSNWEPTMPTLSFARLNSLSDAIPLALPNKTYSSNISSVRQINPIWATAAITVGVSFSASLFDVICEVNNPSTTGEWYTTIGQTGKWWPSTTSIVTDVVPITSTLEFISKCTKWWLSWKMNVSSCLLSQWPWFNSQPWRSISREFFLVDQTLATCPESEWQKMA